MSSGNKGVIKNSFYNFFKLMIINLAIKIRRKIGEAFFYFFAMFSIYAEPFNEAKCRHHYVPLTHI